MVIPQVGDVTPVGFTKAGKTLAKLIAKQGQHVSIDRLLWAGNGDFVTATLSVDAQSYSYQRPLRNVLVLGFFRLGRH